MRYGFGVDVGGTTVKLGFFDETGERLACREIPTRTEACGEAILPDIAAAVEDILKEQKIAKENVIGIGIGVPGAVNDRGDLDRCVNIGGKAAARAAGRRSLSPLVPVSAAASFLTARS